MKNIMVLLQSSNEMVKDLLTKLYELSARYSKPSADENASGSGSVSVSGTFASGSGSSLTVWDLNDDDDSCLICDGLICYLISDELNCFI